MFLWQKTKQNKTKLHKTKCVKITRLRETEKDGKLFCTQIKHFKRKKDKLKIENRNQGVRKSHYSDKLLGLYLLLTIKTQFRHEMFDKNTSKVK